MPLRESPPRAAAGAATRPPSRTSVVATGTADQIDIGEAGIPRPETIVYGSLLDSSYTPIRGARSAGVSFVDHTGLRRSSDAKDEGAYALHSLGFGRYWVTASADGYRSLEEMVDLRIDGPLLRRNFSLQKEVALRVHVTTPEGENLLDLLTVTGAPRGARLLVPVATREPPGKRFDGVIGSVGDTSSVGHFQSDGPRMDKLAPSCLGILLLDCDLPVWVSLVHYQVVLQTQRVDAGQDEVTFVLSPGDLLAGLAQIRVQVIDAETGLPLQHARVMLRGGPYSDQGVATDPQGIATIGGREPGLFELHVRADGYERFRTPIDALPGATTALGTVALNQEVTVVGRVLDIEGHPLAASFSLGLLDPAGHSAHWFRHEGFRSDGDGSFEMTGLSRREYVIRTSNHDAVNDGEWAGVTWVSGNLLVDARAGSISGLEVRLRPASKLVLHVAEGVGDGLKFRIVDGRGFDLVESSFHGSEPRPLQLPAGNYRVFLLDPAGTVLMERSATLGSETIRLDLTR